MKLNRTGSLWDRNQRNDINENWNIIEGDYRNIIDNVDNSYAEIVQARSVFDTLNDREDAQDTNYDQTNRLLLSDIKGRLQKGYYSSTSGEYREGVNWYHYLVYNGTKKVVELSHDDNIPYTIRVVEFTSKMDFIQSNIVVNGRIQLHDDCSIFAIALQLENADPNLSNVTKWSNIDDILKIRVTVGSSVIEVVNSASEFLTGYLSNTLKKGYYTASSGRYNEGVNWYHYLVDVAQHKQVYIYAPTDYHTRLVQMDSDFNALASQTVGRGYVDVLVNCKYISLQMQLENSEPNISSLTILESIKELEQIKICAVGSFVEQQMSKNAPKIKVLSVGNSFSRQAHRGLYRMLNGEVDIELANAHISGQTLEGHWNEITNSNSSYNYEYKNLNTATERTDSGVTFNYCLNQQEWDIITIQQGSPLSGMHETFEPYLSNIINHIKLTQPQAKIALHMTWAYSSNSASSGFSNYNNDQLTMYNGIVDAYSKAAKQHDIGIIIPTGTAIQNARTNNDLFEVGDELTGDGIHLDGAVGEQIAGLVWWGSLFADKYGKPIDSIDYVNVDEGTTNYLMKLAKTTAKISCINPFKITSV